MRDADSGLPAEDGWLVPAVRVKGKATAALMLTNDLQPGTGRATIVTGWHSSD